MATITFDNARDMATGAEDWMKKVSDFIQNPATSPVPTDIYSTQKLAFEIDPLELKSITNNSERLLGIIGFESETTLSLILVGTDKKYTPSATVLPIETFPIKADMSQLSTVLNTYLKP